ncbi:hypothetical protein HWV23_02755 [Natronomonas halophila]|uniref:hypothetical protein n=1 Tax=Natronomonas halophila TaxID=2747817 RepID=UPI0015B6E9EE|nr:hypothetical protein [Natronomonas halophila]QLD84622.1 hypothetical protein HWV23_02480 [Natronomonas halophila]QLD84676.1 hypothetical protein HWV23_02755 [Natronomonas halophila]
MGTRGSELTQTERRAREAMDAMQEDQLWKLGEYKMNYAGSSTRVTAASEFCDRNGLEVGDDVDQYLHAESGALVIVPSQSEE